MSQDKILKAIKALGKGEWTREQIKKKSRYKASDSALVKLLGKLHNKGLIHMPNKIGYWSVK